MQWVDLERTIAQSLIRTIAPTLELLLDGNVVTEFSIGGSVGGLGTIGRA
ncbi:MAG: hypothetical protein H7237_00985 [Alkalinema sp. FL-bin-369]|nr:hypothetical protein [Leptolyngbyaceae cyanobacterium LF-bin-369]